MADGWREAIKMKPEERREGMKGRSRREEGSIIEKGSKKMGEGG